MFFYIRFKWAIIDILSGNNIMARDFQQCGILTSVVLDEPVQPPFKAIDSVSSLTVIEYTSD